MRYKITFAVGLGFGYLVGTRAGRARYEQIARAARSIRDNPSVQETAGVVGAQATQLLHTATDSATHKLGDALGDTAVGEKLADTAIGDKLGIEHSDSEHPNGRNPQNT